MQMDKSTAALATNDLFIDNPASHYFSELSEVLFGVADQLRENRTIGSVRLQELINSFSAKTRDIPGLTSPDTVKASLEEALGIATCDVPADRKDRERMLAEVERTARACFEIAGRLNDGGV